MESKHMVTKGEEGINYKFGINKHTLTVYKIDKQQGPIVYARKLDSISCNNL